jgi:hypothetical protein
MQENQQLVKMDTHPITGFSLWAERIANNKERNHERNENKKAVRREQWALKYSKKD